MSTHKHTKLIELIRKRDEQLAENNKAILTELKRLYPQGSRISYKIGNMKEPAVGQVLDHYTHIDSSGCTVQNTKTQAVRPVSTLYILDKAEAPVEELQPELG